MFQNYLKRHWVRVLVSLLILSTFLLHASQVHEWELINRFDRIAYDLRLRLTMPQTSDDRIVQWILDVINFFGMNGGMSANNPALQTRKDLK